MPAISALKEKGGGGSGEGRQFGGGGRVVGVPATEEEGGRRGGWDDSVRWRPIGLVAQTFLTRGRRRSAGPSGQKASWVGLCFWAELTGWAGIKYNPF
jgi:hypothetical protein